MAGVFLKKRCPKCRGNLYLESYYYGWYEHCLQCSYRHYLDTTGLDQEQVYEDDSGPVVVAR